MDDTVERQATGGSGDGLAEIQPAMTSQLLEYRRAASPLDGSGNALRQQQPPRNCVSVPGIDDGVRVDVEQVSFHDFDPDRQSRPPS